MKIKKIMGKMCSREMAIDILSISFFLISIFSSIGLSSTNFTCGAYVCVKFTTNETWTVPAGVTSVDVLVVGGGGNGGSASLYAGAGGGGGGQFNYTENYPVSGTVNVTVGNSTQESKFGTITAAAGNNGTSVYMTGGYGGASGNGYSGGVGGSTYGGGGGGGGDSENGSASSSNGGRGGNGSTSNITGTSLNFSGGGGGGGSYEYYGSAGIGVYGGGNGGTYPSNGAANGASGTGGGGGGGSGGGGGKGGSGIVILRYSNILTTDYSVITSNNTYHWPGSTLMGNCTVSDSVGDIISYDARWYMNDTIYYEFIPGNILAGDTHACAILTNGSAYCWGYGANGELGYGGVSEQDNPTAVNVSALTTKTFKHIAPGSTHTCGILTNGSAYCWGSGSLGQLGYGGISQQNNPTAVNVSALSTQTFNYIGGGYQHSCGLLTNGSAYCWGNGSYGVLGYGGTTNQNNPIAVNTSQRFKVLSTKWNHACGILTNGSAYCWGLGTYGRLGYGGTSNQANPIAVNVSALTTKTFKSISAGYRHTCGILTNGSAYCWGNNSEGELGYGGLLEQDNPIAVNVSGLTVKTFKSISAGTFFTCGILTNGSAYCWGKGSTGQLGYGGTTSKYIPYPVNISSTFKDIVTGMDTNYACGILTNGSAYCWGAGTNGQLGYGSATQQNNPIAVNTSGLSSPRFWPFYTEGISINVNNLSSYMLENNQTWNFECRASDDFIYSDWLNSSDYMIDNITPVISGINANTTYIFVNYSARFNATVSDDINISTVKFNIQMPNGTTVNATYTGHSGNHYWIDCNQTSTICKTNLTGQYNLTSVWANDTNSNIASNSSTLRNFTVNILNPPITTDNSTSTWSNNTQIIKLTCTNQTMYACSYVKYCIDTAGNCTPTTAASISAGTYNISVNCSYGQVCFRYLRYQSNDTLGNTESTRTSNLIRISNITLNMSFKTPTEINDATIYRNWTLVNITITEPVIDTMKFNWNGSNYTFYENSLILALNFNNNSAIGDNHTSALDITGYGNNATVRGSALKFDGTGQYASFGNDSSLVLGKNMTIEFWMKPASYPVGWARMVGKGQGVNRNYGIFMYSNGSLLWQFYNGTAGLNCWNNLGSSDPLYAPIGTWTHVIGTYDGYNMSVYINGGLGKTYPTTQYPANDTNNLTMGNMVSPSYPYNGTLDEVRIYNRSISAAEALQHYNGNFSNDTGLVLYIPFMNRSGENVTDFSGFGNNGTLTNFSDTTAGAGDSSNSGWTTYGRPLWTNNGKYGYAFNFNGIDDYASIIPSTSINSTTKNLTIIAWVKTRANSGNQNVVAAKNNYFYRIRADASNWWVLLGNGSNYVITNSSSNIIPANTWTHIAVTFTGDGITNTTKLYQNGTLVNSRNINISTIGNTSINYYYLGTYTGTSEYFNGSIDEIRIYNRTLNDSEIWMQYSSNLEKYNMTEWRFYSNVSNLSLGDYTYYGWANNTFSRTNQTEIRNLHVSVYNESVSNISYAIRTTGGGQFLIMVGEYIYNATAPGNINDGAWHHVAATYNGSIMKIYVDGNLAATNNASSGKINRGNGNFRIGTNALLTPNSYFNGSLDELRIMNYTLSDMEIKDDYVKGTKS